MDRDIAARVTQILAEQALLTGTDLRPEMTLDEAGLDSLAVVEAIYSIEEAFDIRVPFNASTPDAGAFRTTTVAGVIAGVEALVAARG